MSAGAEPLVSILVPAYNAEATLADTLQSALANSYGNLEVVVVDDGSTDGTYAIAQEFALKDQRVRAFAQPHRGVSAALNHGLAEVRGEFIARLDSDDLWHPAKIGKQVKLLTADPKVALVYTFVRYIDGSGRVLRDAAPQRLAGYALCQCLYQGIVGGGSSVVFRRSALDSIGGYDEALSIWEDLLVHLRVAAVGAIAFVPEYLTAYRLRATSSSNDRDLALADWRVASRRIEATFPEIPPFVRRWSNGRWLLDLAEGFAVDGRHSTSAALIAECLGCDFARTSTFLGSGLERLFRGRRRRPPAEGPLFADCAPDRSCSFAGAGRASLRALDASRIGLLQTLDREIAASRGGEP